MRTHVACAIAHRTGDLEESRLQQQAAAAAAERDGTRGKDGRRLGGGSAPPAVDQLREWGDGELNELFESGADAAAKASHASNPEGPEPHGGDTGMSDDEEDLSSGSECEITEILKLDPAMLDFDAQAYCASHGMDLQSYPTLHADRVWEFSDNRGLGLNQQVI